MKTIFLLFTLLILGLLPTINADFIYYEKLYHIYPTPIDLIVTDNYDDFPDRCKTTEEGMITAGCAIIFINKEDVPINIIMLYGPYLDVRDPYGLTSLHHELLHIWCQCNWHGD